MVCHHVSSGSFVLYDMMVFVEVVEPVLPGFNVCPEYLPYKKKKKAECIGETEKKSKRGLQQHLQELQTTT